MSRTAATEQTVLELRIHGVANTPPHGMLDLPPGEVEQCDGDGLGSFWTPTPDADVRDRVPGTEPPVDPGDLHAIRSDVRREAYSWGAMARWGTFPLSGLLGAAARGATRALWALNVPFGLANVAFWARRVPGVEAGRGDGVSAGGDETTVHARPEPTAAAVRVFGLALTLLLTAALTTVSVLVVGTRCMGVVEPGGATTVAVCARIPAALDGLARTDHGDRAAILSVVPVLVVLVLVLLARSGQVRFDDRVSLPRAGQKTAGAATGPLLYRAGFWSRRVAGPSALLAHLAAAVALVAILLAWTADRSTAGTLVMGAGALVLGLAAVVVALRNDDLGIQVTPPGWKGGLAVGAFVLALAAWVGAIVLSAGRAPGGPLPAYVGIDVAPTVLGAALTGLAAAALVWRRHVRTLVWVLVPVVVTACLSVVALARTVGSGGRAVATYGQTTTAVLVWVAVAALAVPLVLALVPGSRSGERRGVGWRGAGPGVFLLTATATAAVLTSLLVLGVQVYLTGGRDVRPDADGALLVQIVRTVPGVEDLPVPSAYTEFGISALVLVATAFVGLVVLAVPGLRDLVRSRTVWIAQATGTESDTTGPTSWAAASIARAEAGRTTGERADTADIPLAARRVVRTRQVAAVTHRAEIAVGVLALASWVTLVVTILLGRTGDSVAGVWEIGWDWLAALAVPVVGALALGLVASFVAAGSDGFARPWGLLWDLMCFLPRSAHPFGPPCYAERTVPEVAARVESWLGAHDQPAGRRAAVAPDRRVVLSAHSLGAVIAVAVVLGRAGNPAPDAAGNAPAPRTDGDGRLGLLTYGVQLRAYFGRFFPSLLGPDVLGTPACSGPAWWGDPWRSQTTAAPDAGGWAPADGPEPAAPTLVRLLRQPTETPAWVNLWRRTDYLGFPVVSYTGNMIDRGAEEVDRGAYLFTVASHSTYFRAWAYHRALGTVLERLEQSQPSQPSPAAPETVGTLEAPRAVPVTHG